MAVFMAATVVGSLAQKTSSTEPKELADGSGAKYKRFDNMHQTRFIEIFLAGREAKTGKLIAACHNTMFTSKGVPTSKETPHRRRQLQEAPSGLEVQGQDARQGPDREAGENEMGLRNARLAGCAAWQAQPRVAPDEGVYAVLSATTVVFG